MATIWGDEKNIGVPALRFGGCDLCDKALLKGDRYLTLIGNYDSTEYGKFGRHLYPGTVVRGTVATSSITIRKWA